MLGLLAVAAPAVREQTEWRLRAVSRAGKLAGGSASAGSDRGNHLSRIGAPDRRSGIRDLVTN